MKISQLKTIVKEAVKEAIQDELKDILLEAVRAPKQTVYETLGTSQTTVAPPNPMNPVMKNTSMPPSDKIAMRESIQNVLGGMMPGSNGTMSATTNNIPLQVTNADTAGPNGKLPEGNVSMEQIMGLMNKR